MNKIGPILGLVSFAVTAIGLLGYILTLRWNLYRDRKMREERELFAERLIRRAEEERIKEARERLAASNQVVLEELRAQENPPREVTNLIETLEQDIHSRLEGMTSSMFSGFLDNEVLFERIETRLNSMEIDDNLWTHTEITMSSSETPPPAKTESKPKEEEKLEAPLSFGRKLDLE